jgi:hypothetical protein
MMLNARLNYFVILLMAGDLIKESNKCIASPYLLIAIPTTPRIPAT